MVFNLDTVVVCYDNELKIETDDNFINYAWSYKADPVLLVLQFSTGIQSGSS